MSTKDYFEVTYWLISLGILSATVYYIYFAPIKAVMIGRDLNDQQAKDTAKRQLFLSLFSYRGSPVHNSFVYGLNQIDVVFNDTPLVLDAWHKYFEALHHKDMADRDAAWQYLRTDLLSQMAIHLGYGALSQTDIMKNYYPEGHEFQNRTEFEYRQAAYDFFKGGADLYKILIKNHLDQQAPTPTIDEDIKQK